MSLGRTLSHGVIALVASAIACAACGGEPEARAPSSAGSSREKTSDGAPAGYPPPPAQPSQTPGAGYAQPPPSAGLEGTADSPWLEFQSARGTFDATTSDCAVACKALASIDRAAGHVCAMATATDHCSAARDTLKAARRKVRAECTVCPGGVSVDPDAPIPSTP